LNDLVAIQKQSALEEAEKHAPESKESTIRVSDLTEWLGHTVPCNRMFEKIAAHQQQAAMTMQETTR
jgi:hypothetical protein